MTRHAMSDQDASPSIDITKLTIEAVQPGFASGAFTAQALIQACLSMITTYNPRYNAISSSTRKPYGCACNRSSPCVEKGKLNHETFKCR